jgi:iron complex outermembrane recepter protein
MYAESGSRLLNNSIEAAALQTSLPFVNTIAEPTHWRVRGTLQWARNEFASSVTINYANAYENTLFSPSQPIGSWTTLDAHFSYDSGAVASSLVRNLNVTLSVQNLTNRRPPFVQIPPADIQAGGNAVPYDGTNASAVGRLIAVQVTKSW